MQQALNVAGRMGRKVCFIGRSVERKAEIAKNLGYLKIPTSLVVQPKKAGSLPKNKIMYIISGSYGQPGSALHRVSTGEHDFLSINQDDVVIFSSDPAPPGSKANVDSVVDNLIEQRVEVHYYDMQEDLHVSGHGSQEDIKMLMAVINPQYLIPIGGTVRHMRAYRDIAVSMGASENAVFEPKPGDIIEFKDSKANKAGSLDVKSVLVDGLGVGDVGNVVLRDRHRLSQDGVAIVLIQLDKNKKSLIEDPEIISRGFVFEKSKKNFLIDAAKKLRNQMESKRSLDKKLASQVTTDFLEKHFYQETRRRPMVLPVVVEV